MSIDPELEALFNWNPPSRALPLTTDASESRPKQSTSPISGFYNKHLSANLLLKKVILLPSLPRNITDLVDLTLSTIQNQGIHFPPKDPDDLCYTQRSRMRADYYENQPDTSVASFYSKTTAKYCLPVASTLALHPTRWHQALQWNEDPGALRILPSLKSVLLGERGTYVSEYEKVLVDSMRKNFDDRRWNGFVEAVKRFPDLMTWEILTESEDIMHSLKDLAGIAFPWMKCTETRYEHHDITRVPRDIPFDATVTPWTIPFPNDDDDVPKTHQNLPAQKLLQQSWAHAVRADSTLICIHTPSLEYIGIRHRATQRLYLSDVIHCQDPGYGKIHVGVYVAALNDAVDRALRFCEKDEKSRGMGGEAGSEDGPDAKDDSLCGTVSDNPRPTKRLRTAGPDGTGQTTSSSAILPETKDYTTAFVYIHYGIYNSPTPSTFIRSNLSPISPASISPPSKHKHIILILTSEIASGATGIIHSATLKVVEPTQPVIQAYDVVVKLSWQKDRLRNEYAIFETLASNGIKGIPTVLGIFDDIEPEEGPSMLIMTHAGTPLHHNHTLSSSQRTAFLSILKDIHNANVLHCDLRRQNLLIDDFDEASIIDFDQSVVARSKKGKKHEYVELVSILDGVGEA